MRARAELTATTESTLRESLEREKERADRLEERAEKLRDELEAERSKGFWARLFGGWALSDPPRTVEAVVAQAALGVELAPNLSIS
jgi:hypothetical protein